MPPLTPEQEAMLAQMLGISPSAVSAVGAGMPSTAFGRLSSPEALIASGIISPDVLGQAFSSVEQSALEDIVAEWDKAAADIYSQYNVQEPQFLNETEYRYRQNPVLWAVVGPLFEDVKSGNMRAEQVPVAARTKLSQDQWAEYFAGQPDAAQRAAEFAGMSLEDALSSEAFPAGTFENIQTDLSGYESAAAQFRQKQYEFLSNEPQRSSELQMQLEMLGPRPEAGSVDMFSERLKFAKDLGMPALALLPDPSAGTAISNADLERYIGGSFSGIQQDIEKQIARAEKGMAAPSTVQGRGRNIQGYGAIGRQPEGVTDQRLAPVGSQMTQGLQGPAVSAGRAPSVPSGGMTQRQIADLDRQIAGERATQMSGGLDVLRRFVQNTRPQPATPFEQSLQSLLGLGEFEARV